MFGRDQRMEEFFSRLAEESAAETATHEEQMRKARLAGYSVLDPKAREVYQRELRQTGSPALAEIAAARCGQRTVLQRAFSLFDDWV